MSAEPLAIEMVTINEARDINDDKKLKASNVGDFNYEASNDDDNADDLVGDLKVEDGDEKKEPPALIKSEPEPDPKAPDPVLGGSLRLDTYPFPV